MGIGTPLAFNNSTMQRIWAFFAKVLVDIDILTNLPSQILVERSGFAFIVDFEYEKFPFFCSHCKMIGHDKNFATKKICYC